MVTDCFITVSGWLYGTIIYGKSEGKNYMTFTIQTSNGVNGGIVDFRCFLWENELYHRINSYKLCHGDNICVRGQLFVNKTAPKNTTAIRITIEHLKCIDTATMRNYKSQDLDDSKFNKDVTKISNNSNSEDDYDWGE